MMPRTPFSKDTFELEMEEYCHYYHLVHDKDSRKLLDGLHLVFVELPKFRPGNLAEKTRRPPLKLKVYLADAAAVSGS